MNFPIAIDRARLFQILGALGGIYPFYSNSNRTFCEQTVEALIRCRRTMSDLGLLCLPMSYKKNAMLIWVKDGVSKMQFSYFSTKTYVVGTCTQKNCLDDVFKASKTHAGLKLRTYECVREE